MANRTMGATRDWLRSPSATLLGWIIPLAALVYGLFVSVPARTGIWITALIWMGAACILNAKRCGRTHCHYTGPYYLVMIGPVMLLGSGFADVGILGWIVVGCVILLGSALLWWGSEQAWGKFRTR